MQVGADPKKKVRPLIAGYSVNAKGGLTGTLGYFVRRQQAVCLFSSQHIMPTIGTPAIQPGSGDNGTSADKVGDVVQALDDPSRGVDCAAAQLLDQNQGSGWKPEINDITGTVSGIAGSLQVDQKVTKSGRTTGVTTGRIKEIGASIQFPEGLYIDQIAVTAGFSDKGDSGALVLTEDLKAVGIVMGGAPGKYVWVNKIERVLAALDKATLV